ncbi:GntR family transcriptional regulator [Caldimonas thermodepolymerans]|jgi:DNA-binding GntR family transcriptional regulator|uniref:GntR family transcriptional regulator n=1 Tax=Caldimonas thermodepolymerans TaxID=215580 RepID=A0A2S5T4R4_9BURK|nr:GntR family transcriptional regulator [Caldimonas thermodepolymerans]PPE69984.1 GntR family transcriptional regulator [Caldimonas thermodepolymerans]QPC31723.1 GntR family transcriptional regulator [Caldimonas thermodepolymerans]RDI01775.1 DNA-binding GntR family transcriptional regulator [Caldimonas thermodepolymerans]TCP05912.1 DNA-binding GntR family transcriptional regulator [Caldimonas thermodepolymerans]UZG44508.1 GntR family transcriptional regulator [Caldimonas thermodepolymerans]
MPRKKSTAPAPAPAAGAQGAQGASVERIAQDIAAAIVEKRLPPGTWLREEALGRVYAVSRTKVRAALLMLAKDKLVETIPDKGTFVSQPSVQEAREVFSVRRVLESEVVRLFVARATARDYDVLEQHIRFERSTLQSPAAGTVQEKLLGDFHVVLAELTGHKVLSELVRELVARSSLIAMLYQSTNDPHCSSDEHAEFLRVCRSGDADAAVRCMLEHLQRVEASLQLEAGPPRRQLDLVKALLL